ncbi:MAG TPA: serine hydrolase domain-containing protein [Capsulimonadaceae bacterium]|nr:serine hydrolase domain-containing protein [Capsulimonadaceae bacterium]
MRTRIKRVLKETPFWLEAGNVPGLSVALLENGKTREVLHFGSTDLGGKARVTDSTIFPAASLSKQAFLYAALKVVETGEIDLDRPLMAYRDKPFGLDDPDIGRITARHVLTHTTGWPNWPEKDHPIERTGAPGKQWGYSGAGFVFLQQALASILDESPEDYTRRLALDPLGMRESSFVWREAYEQTAACGSYPNGSTVEPWKPAEANGASSLHATAREYALLLEAYLAPELRQTHPDVYSQQIAINARIGWTLGWGCANDALWQWSHNEGIKSFAAIVPSRGLGIACFTNGERGQRINREWVNAWLETDLPAFYFRVVEL